MNTLLWLFAGVFVLFVVIMIARLFGDSKLRQTGVLPKRGEATIADVRRLAQSGEKILAIRVYREIHSVSLVEAKEAVEAMTAGNVS